MDGWMDVSPSLVSSSQFCFSRPPRCCAACLPACLLPPSRGRLTFFLAGARPVAADWRESALCVQSGAVQCRASHAHTHSRVCRCRVNQWSMVDGCHGPRKGRIAASSQRERQKERPTDLPIVDHSIDPYVHTCVCVCVCVELLLSSLCVLCVCVSPFSRLASPRLAQPSLLFGAERFVRS